MTTFLTLPGGSPAVGPTNGGKVWAFNAIGNSSPTAVLAINSDRVSITFHNPGANDILVYPNLNAVGQTQAPTSAAPGGAFRIFANGGTLIISGECQGAWSAIAVSGTNQSLTVMESNV